MPTLYAFLVAVNEYPDPKHRLNGCINDLKRIEKCLMMSCALLEYDIKIKILTNRDATRAEIINGFHHFQEASPVDPCLFYFAGHGSRSWSPPEFWHLEPDHKNASIVCFDSRTKGGRDLMDKELSYLVWQANKDKDVPFVTITDCCHSGNLRDFELNQDDMAATTRQIRDTGEALSKGEYIGIEFYKSTSDGRLSPPQGRRIHLGAASNIEKAKEITLNNEPRGIFTHFLAETLQQIGPLISYIELFSRIKMRVRANISEQSPQLWATKESDKYVGFLSHTPVARKPIYLIGFDKNKGWTLNAGTLHGLKQDTVHPIQLEIPVLQRTVELAEIGPHLSIVHGMKDNDLKQTYAAFLPQDSLDTPKISIKGSDSSPLVEQIEHLFNNKRLNAQLELSNQHSSDYIIHVDNEKVWISTKLEIKPLFPPLYPENYQENSIITFISNTYRIHRWHKYLALNNPHSQIESTEYEFQLYKITEAGNLNDDAPASLINWQESPVTFEYTSLNSIHCSPAFQLKIKNTTNRPLWFCVLYFSCDYSISNALLSKKLLSPNEETWAFETFKNNIYKTIPLNINDQQIDAGVRQVDEYFKIIISTEEPDSDLICQEGIILSYTEPYRNMGFQSKHRQDDWKYEDIWIRISIPD